MKMKEFAKAVAGIMPVIHTELVKAKPDFLLKEKITLPQMVIMNVLSGQGACKMSDISELLGVTRGAVTGLTDRLIRSGLIRRIRSKTDRRVVTVELSPKGVRYARGLGEFKNKVISRVFSNISQKERMQYLVILRKLERNIKAKGECRYYA